MSRSGILSITDTVRRAIVYVAGTVIVACTAVIGTTLMLGVIVRYILGGSLPWSSELPVILFPWLIMAGIVAAAARNQHLGVDYLARKLPPGGQRAIKLAGTVAIIALMLVLTTHAMSMLAFLQYQSTPVLGWPATYAFYSLPTGLLGVALIALLQVPETLLGRSGSDAPGEVTA